MIGVVAVSCVTTLVSVLDIFQSTLQWLASKVALGAFVKHGGLVHDWDETCYDIKGYPNFDVGLALGASVVGWVMVLPSLYLISDVLIPGLPPFIEPLVHNQEGLVAKVSIEKRWTVAWKHISIMAPDLWCAEAAQRWLQFVKANTPYDSGPRAPSVSQAEKQVRDPVKGTKSSKRGKLIEGVHDADSNKEEVVAKESLAPT